MKELGPGSSPARRTTTRAASPPSSTAWYRCRCSAGSRPGSWASRSWRCSCWC